MNECPDCGGLLIQDDGSDDFLIEPTDSYYCPGCGWSSDEQSDNDEDENEICGNCGGTGNLHWAGCSEDDAIWY